MDFGPKPKTYGFKFESELYAWLSSQPTYRLTALTSVEIGGIDTPPP